MSWRVAQLIPALLACGCLSSALGSNPATGGNESDAPLGAFEISTSGLARARIEPGSCLAGDREQFLGADLVDKARKMVVRLAVDPLEGPALRVYDAESPFERSVLFFREDCTTFTFELEPTGWIVNDVIVRALTLEVDCENPDGATISGRASARCG